MFSNQGTLRNLNSPDPIDSPDLDARFVLGLVPCKGTGNVYLRTFIFTIQITELGGPAHTQKHIYDLCILLLVISHHSINLLRVNVFPLQGSLLYVRWFCVVTLRHIIGLVFLLLLINNSFLNMFHYRGNQPDFAALHNTNNKHECPDYCTQPKQSPSIFFHAATYQSAGLGY
uniref:Uncharacterized protein n=1 Tax=Glossina palpalis gambiensis TaxID=67801 RepID=A0A1B0AYH4_9MUSC